MKLKQITAMALMGTGLIMGTRAIAVECAKDQWNKGGNCYACPKNATCDGKSYKCRAGTEVPNTVSGAKENGGVACVPYDDVKHLIFTTYCNESEYVVIPKSWAGYGDLRFFWDADKWGFGGSVPLDKTRFCAKCPDGADCSNGKVTCRDGYVRHDLGSWEVACAWNRMCNQNEYWTGEYCTSCPTKCKACPANATCNGSEIFTCKDGYKRVGDTCIADESCKEGYMTSKGCVKECSYVTGFPYYLSSENKCVTEKECTSMGYVVNTTNGFCEKKAQCKVTEYLGTDGKTCMPCPKNGVCDGGPWQGCPKGFFDAGPEGCKPQQCQTSQYIVSKTCTMCPANATCDGKTAKCNSGYENISKDLEKVVCKKIETKCPSGQISNGKVCTTGI